MEKVEFKIGHFTPIWAKKRCLWKRSSW